MNTTSLRINISVIKLAKEFVQKSKIVGVEFQQCMDTALRCNILSAVYSHLRLEEVDKSVR